MILLLSRGIQLPPTAFPDILLAFFLQHKCNIQISGAQLLRGRLLDSRPKGRGFEPNGRHCVVSLSKTQLPLLSTGSTREDPSRDN